MSLLVVVFISSLSFDIAFYLFHLSFEFRSSLHLLCLCSLNFIRFNLFLLLLLNLPAVAKCFFNQLPLSHPKSVGRASIEIFLV